MTMIQTPIRCHYIGGQMAYDFQLYSRNSSTISDIMFHTHPLLLERSGDIDRYRLATADVDRMELLVDDRVVSTIPNYYRDTPVMHYSQMSGIYSVNVEPFQSDHIYRELLSSDPVLRVYFWREPISPVWITFCINACLNDLGTSSRLTRSYDGSWWEYRWRSLLPY